VHLAISLENRFQEEETMKRKASAVWQGGLKDGKGTISTDSGVLSNTQYSFATRFEMGIGTMQPMPAVFPWRYQANLAMLALFQKASTRPLFTVTEVHLDVRAKIPGASLESFETASNNAKTGCPISRLLNTKITMEAKLES